MYIKDFYQILIRYVVLETDMEKGSTAWTTVSP